MRDNVSICLRMITGFQGRFSDELESYWREIERQYKCCNVMMIPEVTIPLWHARCVDKGIPIEAKSIPIREPLPYVCDNETNDPTASRKSNTFRKMHWKTRQALDRKAAAVEV